ncbi:MAG TPA: ATP synthase F1 subunit delta [Candidatus Angelobacter sp.]|nr:ATP synthase F1 subunit delta [Candidatus Angelobacter sp.]
MAAAAGRYARALAEVIVERKGDAAQAVAALDALAALVGSTPELRTVWQNPSVEHAKKIALLDAIIAKLGATKLVRNFVAVLIDQRRIGQIQEIVRQFQHELNQRLGIAEAKVMSARELAAAEKQTLERQLAVMTGKKIQAAYMHDSALLGGALVRIGSTIYDGSVRGQLQRIKEQIAQ